MKKIVFAVLATVMLLSAVLAPIGVSAATKDDVLNEFKTIPAHHYIYDEVEQLANNHPLTSEQYDKLLEWCKEIKEAFPEDKGRSFHSYPAEAQAKMLTIMYEVADYLNLKIEIKPSENPVHTNDDVVFVYDPSGKLIFRYDGDEIRKTDTAESADYALYAIISASAIVLAFAAFAIVSKKRSKKHIAG